jgi:hypothetical protein
MKYKTMIKRFERHAKKELTSHISKHGINGHEDTSAFYALLHTQNAKTVRKKSRKCRHTRFQIKKKHCPVCNQDGTKSPKITYKQIWKSIVNATLPDIDGRPDRDPIIACMKDLEITRTWDKFNKRQRDENYEANISRYGRNEYE